LQTLLSIIANRQLNYVFCIKPNDKQQQKLFDLSSVQHQVRYMSLMPLVHLWRTGYYFNLSHKSFLNRYKLVSPLTWPHYHKGTIVEGIALIIRSVPLPAAEFTIGGKRVFIRSPRTVSCVFTHYGLKENLIESFVRFMNWRKSGDHVWIVWQQ
jgi:myosin I